MNKSELLFDLLIIINLIFSMNNVHYNYSVLGSYSHAKLNLLQFFVIEHFLGLQKYVFIF